MSESTEECMSPCGKICNIRGKYLFSKGVFVSFEGLGIQHSLYIPVGHLASIPVLALVINRIEINFLVSVINREDGFAVPNEMLSYLSLFTGLFSVTLKKTRSILLCKW